MIYESPTDKRDKVAKSLAEIARHLYSIQSDLPTVIESDSLLSDYDAKYLNTILSVVRRAHENVCEILKGLG